MNGNAVIFVVAAALIVTVTFVLLAWPLLKRSGAQTRGAKAPRASAAILREQLTELEAGLNAGILTSEQFEEGKHELARRLLEEVTRAPASQEPAQGTRRVPWLAAAIGGFLLVVSFALYFALGTPGSLAPTPAATGSGKEGSAGPITQQQVEAMVDRLAERLKTNPNDGQGWAMLARSYNVLGRFPEASKAYEKAVALLPGDAQLLADYADALAMALGKKLEGEPMKLVEQALKIDPSNAKALALAATDAFDHKNYSSAISFWERSLKTVPPGSDVAQQLQANIQEARQRAGGGAAPAEGTTLAAGGAPGGSTVAPSSGAAGEATATPPATSGPASVQGIVTLASSLTSKASPEDTVFIFARAVDGPRMPVALLRKQVKDLPLEFTLDESMAMVPAFTLAQYRSVVIGARVSKRGDAIAQSGDLEGFSKTVPVGSTGVAVQIDKVVP